MIATEPCAGGRVRVWFSVPAAYETVAVVADFNGWDAECTLFRRTGDRRTATVVLACGRRYRFRYVMASGRECNDEAADDYLVDHAGGYFGMLDLATTTGVEDRAAEAGKRPGAG